MKYYRYITVKYTNRFLLIGKLYICLSGVPTFSRVVVVVIFMLGVYSFPAKWYTLWLLILLNVQKMGHIYLGHSYHVINIYYKTIYLTCK